MQLNTSQLPTLAQVDLATDILHDNVPGDIYDHSVDAGDIYDHTGDAGDIYDYDYPEIPACSLCHNLTFTNCHHTGLGKFDVK